MKIAYLAPEIPALSATFVYNEILQLEILGTQVVPFSVHEPLSNFQDEDVAVENLKQKVLPLYRRSKLEVIEDNILLFFTQPRHYLRTLCLLISDVGKVGLFSRTAIGLMYRFLFAGFLAKALIDNQCSHIHVHFAHVPADIAMYAASLAGISFSVTAHANDIFERGWLLAEKVKRSAFFATISEFNKHYLAALGVDAGKIRIVRCGVDFNQFARRQKRKRNKKMTIGIVARLVEKKGLDTLIRSLAILKKQGEDAELLIAGSGPLENELRLLISKCDLLTSDVRFLGAIPHPRVAGFIRSLDVFVLPCKPDTNGDMDGIPVVLMEAMLSGIPVISTRLSGIPELVEDNITGLLIQPDDDQALAEAIRKIAHDNIPREQMIESAIAKVKDEFSLASNTEKLNGLFKNMVSPS